MDHNVNKFGNFMNGFAAATQILQRAGENGFFIEYIILAASLIDGLLRMGLIFDYQIKNNTKEVLDSLLYQSDGDKIISERQIYKMALKRDILPHKLFDKLEQLYKKRNRVVHRYVISDIKTKEIVDIAHQYEKIMHSVNKTVEKLEEKQIESGKGMDVSYEKISIEKFKSILDKMSEKKHGDPILSDALRQKKSQ